jgi:hypothetical protein
MLQGVTTAYVATKRVQASHPMLLHVADVKAARAAYRGTRIENLLIAKDHEVEFPAWKFEGVDYREFIDTTIRSLCAAWQIPWELVMGDHSAKSGASSRSLWQQHYQMAEREQADYVNAVQRPMDESIMREINERQGLGLGDDWWANMAGVYQGPPKVMPDPQKESLWAEGMRALGMSRSTILNRFGEDFRDEIMQDRQDAELADAQAPDAEDEQEDEAARTAPANDDPGPDETQEIEPPAEALRDARMFAMVRDAVEAATPRHPAPVSGPPQTINLSVPMTVQIPKQDPTPVSVAAPEVHVAAPIVNVAAAEIPRQAAPIVNVAAPAVTFEAAAPAPVVVNVSPTPVTIENTIEVPQRAIRVTTNPDGSATMRPEA